MIDHTSAARNNVFFNVHHANGTVAMGDFNRKIEETTDRIEKEAADIVRYLNDEVVPAVRQHSTKALRIAAQKMQELANYMEQHSAARK
ncbi:MAG TPA: hypothetical protein VH596_04585 [Terriglobales bacterium]